MKRDTAVRLLHRESQELSHQFASGDLELLRVLGDEFIEQRLLGRDGFDVVHEKSVDDEVVVSGPLHEDCLLAVDRRISDDPLSSIHVEIRVCHRRAACLVP